MKHTAYCEAAIRRRPSGLLRDGRKVGVIFCKVDLPAYLHSEICQEPDLTDCTGIFRGTCPCR